MAIFTEEGYVNPIHVVKVRDVVKGSMLDLTNGSTVRVNHRGSGEVAAHLDPVVPAQPGFEVLNITKENGGLHKLLENENIPIVAWRIDSSVLSGCGWPHPITVNCADITDVPQYIRSPDGRVFESGNPEVYKDLDTLLNYLDARDEREAKEEEKRKEKV